MAFNNEKGIDLQYECTIQTNMHFILKLMN